MDWLIDTGRLPHTHTHTHVQDFERVHLLIPGCVTNRNRSQINCDKETFS